MHIEYVTHRCGHASEVPAKAKANGGVGRGGDAPCCSCSIKHLMMMSETVALLLWRVERRSILWYIDIHTSERRLSNSIFSLLLTSCACPSGDVDFSIHWINMNFKRSFPLLIVQYPYLYVRNHSTDVLRGKQAREKKASVTTLSLPFLFSPMHLSCISDLLRLSWFERTTQFAFSSYPRMISHVFLYTKNVCWWHVISDADVFHTRPVSFDAFIVCFLLV